MLVFPARSRRLTNVDVVVARREDQVHIVAKAVPRRVHRERPRVFGCKCQGSPNHTGSRGMTGGNAREADEHTNDGKEPSPWHRGGMGANAIRIMPHDDSTQHMKPCINMAGFKGNHTWGNAGGQEYKGKAPFLRGEDSETVRC